MRCVTVQLSDPLHVWKSIKERSRAVCMRVRLQLCLPSTLSDTVYLLQSPPVLTFPLGFTLAQSHTLRWEAGGGGLCCHTNKHMRNQDPEKVQWEQVSLFTCGSHGGLRSKYPHHFIFTPPALVLLELFTWMGRWENGEFGALTESSQHTHRGPSNDLFTRTTCNCPHHS